MEIKKQIEELEDELITLRRDFHAHPELGFKEFRTSRIIFEYLQDLGLEVSKVAKTGVVGVLSGKKPGKTIMLRADMDAVPVQEENDVPYKSKNDGVMHACGHDGHVAMLLVAAKILSRYKDDIKGNIKFVFQPNEEEAGAKYMIEEGVMDNPKVDAALGLHLWSLIDSGQIGIISGAIMASSYYFKINIFGKGGHAGAPHNSIDPIICATNIIQAAQTIQTREIDVLLPTVISFCKLQAGSSPTIIPQSVELEGSIRCLYDDVEDVIERFERIIKNICAAYRNEYTLDIECGNPLVKNDKAMTILVKEVANQVVSESNIRSDVQVMLGEDFSEFGAKVPSAFYFVGIKNSEKETDFPHHHPKFNIDEDILALGVEMHIRTALRYLGR